MKKYCVKILVITIVNLISFEAFTQPPDTVFLKYNAGSYDTLIYEIDTLFKKVPFGPNYIFESDWITNSSNQLGVLGYGIHASSIEAECKKNKRRIELRENKLVNWVKTDSSLIFEYEVVENCCYSFLCDMEILNEKTLNLIYHGYGSICGCTCVHNLKYELSLDFLDDEYEENFMKLTNFTLNNELNTKFKK